MKCLQYTIFEKDGATKQEVASPMQELRAHG